MKSSPVYFYVQRNTQFATKNVLIQFEIESLNVGGAMNLESGIFTAPRPGTYFFSISGFYDNFLYFAAMYIVVHIIGIAIIPLYSHHCCATNEYWPT